MLLIYRELLWITAAHHQLHVDLISVVLCSADLSRHSTADNSTLLYCPRRSGALRRPQQFER